MSATDFLTDRLTWPRLRPGLCADLGFSSVDALCKHVRFADTVHATAALKGEVPPSNELMVSLLHAWPTVPVLYFIQSTKGKNDE